MPRAAGRCLPAPDPTWHPLPRAPAQTDKNIEQLKLLNRAIFPINYPERMYKDILAYTDVTQAGCGRRQARADALARMPGWRWGRGNFLAARPAGRHVPGITRLWRPPSLQLAYHNDVLVGAIACRLEKSAQVGGGQQRRDARAT